VASPSAKGIYEMAICPGAEAAAPFILAQFNILSKSKIKEIFKRVSSSFKPSAVAQVVSADEGGIY
jgi:hypothetical protein